MVPSGKEKDDPSCEGVALYRKANGVVRYPRYSRSAHPQNTCLRAGSVMIEG